ncbi:glycoside hydrolase family 19 protein, partial [Pseudomonas kitaguniensis]|uniref:glycoside hydrolase family 19 protein n=1 Tax=Pseudomonas kitaguniensis TaxID=2607908 RepID=UPI003D06CF4F
VKGDGSKYRGRGLIQITGRANYAACAEALGLDLVNQPELLEQPQHAAMSAAWFWSTRGLNTLADQGEFAKITRRINGGLTGQEDRLQLWERAKKVLA